LKKLPVFLFLACLAASPATATTIFTPTFTSAFNTNFGANAAAAQAAWLAAANILGSSISDNIHINVIVDAVAGTSVLGQSSTPLISTSFLNLYNHLVSDATSADDLTATGAGGSLNGGTDPIGGSSNWWVSRVQAKALSIIADDLVNDGTVTFGAGFSYTFSGAIAPGTYDFQGVVLHELTELMGRIGISGGTVGASPNSYTVVDAYSYSAPGVRVTGNGGPTSFSINAGSTLLKSFNNASGNGGDSRDWASGTNDSFNAFNSIGVANGLSAVDLRMLDVIGFDLTTPVPEPGSVSLLLSGMGGIFYFRRRKQRQ
jgi:hypothetical protein